VIDGTEEYRAEPGSVRNAGISQTNIFPVVNSDWRSKLNSRRRVRVKDRLQVAICETVEVDDDGDIFGRQRINGTDRDLREMNIASFSIQASLARIAW